MTGAGWAFRRFEAAALGVVMMDGFIGVLVSRKVSAHRGLQARREGPPAQHRNPYVLDQKLKMVAGLIEKLLAGDRQPLARPL